MENNSVTGERRLKGMRETGWTSNHYDPIREHIQSTKHHCRCNILQKKNLLVKREDHLLHNLRIQVLPREDNVNAGCVEIHLSFQRDTLYMQMRAQMEISLTSLFPLYRNYGYYMTKPF